MSAPLFLKEGFDHEPHDSHHGSCPQRLLIISLIAACANPIGSRVPTGSNQPPAAVQFGNSSIQSDPQAEALEQVLTDLDNQLKSSDLLDDLN
jgi:hypothetical protein